MTAVALRVLVLAAGDDDVLLPAWQSILDRIGTPYDVLRTDEETVSRRRLVREDGVGRYSAVLLTSGGLLRRDRRGRFASALDPVGWSLLWEYERAFAVRQVALAAAPGAGPEQLTLRLAGEGPTGPGPLPLTLTPAGARVFGDLRPDARLPLADAYVYRARVPYGAAVTPLLEADGDVVAALAPARDGRERLVVGFTVGAGQPIEEHLGPGLVRWATRGVLLGEHRHWLNVDVDDWSDLDGARVPPPPGAGDPVAGGTAAQVAASLLQLRAEFPVARDLTLNLAYNAAASPPPATPAGPSVQAFRWVNHTWSHPSMEATSYERSRAEIADNLVAARRRGLPVDPAVLKTPGWSGLGVLVRPEPGAPVVDDGLEASNPGLLAAAHDLGVRYVHGNMSFASHRPPCFNGGTAHPLQPEITVVPDWPTAIPWWAGTPEQVEAGYTAVPGLDYEAALGHEADVALRHVLRGSVYTHTLHRANTYAYAPGRSVAADWLRALLRRYTATHRAPLLTPDWTALAAHVAARTAHARAVEDGPDAVWDRAAGTVTCRAGAATTLFVTGADVPPDGGRPPAEVYGDDRVLRLDLDAGEEVAATAHPTPDPVAGTAVAALLPG